MKRVGILALILLLFLTTPVFAQDNNNEPTANPSPTPLVPQDAPSTGIDLTVSPVFINLLADPGEEVSSEIKIKNNNNETEYLEISLVRFEASEDGARPKIADIDPDDEFINWISFSNPQFTLAPNETKTIDVNITPPESSGLGYYYGVMFQRISEGSSDGLQTLVAGAPVVSILLEVDSPNAKRELQLLDFTTDKLFYEYLPTEFQVTVENTGNIHLIPFGNIFIDSLSKKDVGVLTFNEGRGNILPDSQRIYTVKWDDAMILRSSTDEDGKAITDDEGNKIVKTNVDFDKPLSSFRFGKYTANLLMVYDNGERDVPLEATISFWVIPWKLILIVIVVIISPVLLYHLIQRRKRKKGK